MIIFAYTEPPVSLWTIAVLLAGCVAGVIGLMAALRDRRIGSQAVCRRCGYDLRGRPEGVHICSECGSDLNRPRAIAHGARQRMTWLAAICILELFIVVPLTGTKCRLLWNSDWRKYKPVWWLVRETSSADPREREHAEYELWERLYSKKLDRDDIESVVKTAVKRPSRIGIEAVAEAKRLGLLSKSDWNAFAAGASPVEIVAKQRMHPGQRMTIALDASAFAIGFSTPTSIRTEVRNLSIDGRPLNVGSVTMASSVFPTWAKYGTSGSRVEISPDQWDSTRLGEHLIVCFVHHSFSIEGSGSTLATWDETKTIERTFRVVAGSEPTVTLVVDPKQRDAVRTAVASELMTSQHRGGLSLGSYFSSELPYDAGFDVLLLHQDTEVNVGSFSFFRRYLLTEILELSQSPMEITPGRYDVILRPSEAAVADRIDINEIWGEPIVYPDVQIGPAESVLPKEQP